MQRRQPASHGRSGRRRRLRIGVPRGERIHDVGQHRGPQRDTNSRQATDSCRRQASSTCRSDRSGCAPIERIMSFSAVAIRLSSIGRFLWLWLLIDEADPVAHVLICLSMRFIDPDCRNQATLATTPCRPVQRRLPEVVVAHVHCVANDQRLTPRSFAFSTFASCSASGQKPKPAISGMNYPLKLATIGAA